MEANPKPMHTLRTRFAGDIVAEFVPPKDRRSNRVLILCGGMPSYPSKPDLMFWLADRGYWPVMPRYRGTWESDGHFLKKSPHLDISDVIDSLDRGFRDLFSGDRYLIRRPQVHLIGSSFGGPAALMNGRDRRVRKVVALSPVIDWRKDSEVEPWEWLEGFTRQAFGNGYRFSTADWKRLTKGQIYNPATGMEKISPKKTLIFHAQDDLTVPFQPTADFCKKTGCPLVSPLTGGHLSLSLVNEPKFWQKIRGHLEG